MPPLDDIAIGIAIVHYRSYDDLALCLASLALFEPSRPVVVVDHAADDAALAALRARFPAVRFEPTSANPGFAAGANRAIRALSTPRVLLLNPDCVLTSPIAAGLEAVLDARGDAGIVGPCVLNNDGSVQASARRFPTATTALAGRRSWLTALAPDNPLSRRNLVAAAPGDATRDVDWVSGACMMIARDRFDAVGGFDEAYFLYWEDADLCRRLLDRNIRTVYHPGVSVTHAGARCSRFNAHAALVAFHASAFRYFRTHAGMAGRILTPVVAMLLGGRLAAALGYRLVAGWAGVGRDRDPAPGASEVRSTRDGR